MSSGHYRMRRGWLDHPALRRRGEPYSRAEAWCWLIENAAWKSRRENIAGQIVDIERGQLASSVRYLGAAWGWPKTTVARFLAHLQSEVMIQMCSKTGTGSGTGASLITICNYDKFQATPSQDGTGAGTEAGQQPGQGAEQKRDSNRDTEPGWNVEVCREGWDGNRDTPPRQSGTATGTKIEEEIKESSSLREGASAPQLARQEGEDLFASPVVDPKAIIFGKAPGGCLAYLIAGGTSEQQARSLLGKWRGQYGDAAVIEAVSAAGRENVSEPVGWITKALASRSQGAGPRGRCTPHQEPPITLDAQGERLAAWHLERLQAEREGRPVPPRPTFPERPAA